MPTYEFFSSPWNSGISASRGARFSPVLDTEVVPHPSVAATMGHKRRRTAVVMEPGSLLSSSSSYGSSFPPSKQDSRTLHVQHAAATATFVNGNRPEFERNHHHHHRVKPTNVTRKVSYDRSNGGGALSDVARVVGPSGPEVPQRKCPSSGSSNCTSRKESTTPFLDSDETRCCDPEHDHAMFQCFQPPPSTLSPSRKTKNNNNTMQTLVGDGSRNAAATVSSSSSPTGAATQSNMTTVSFSNEDFEPIPLDQQEGAFFGHSRSNSSCGSNLHNNSDTALSSSDRYKRDERSSRDHYASSSSHHGHQQHHHHHHHRGGNSRGYAGSTSGDHHHHHHESAHQGDYDKHHHHQHGNSSNHNNSSKRSCCDEDEYPSWMLDLDTVPSGDDDVLNFLESNKEMTTTTSSSISHHASSSNHHNSNSRNPRWDSMLMTYTNAATSTTDRSSPALFRKRCDKGKEPPKHGPDTLTSHASDDSSSPVECRDLLKRKPFPMTQKKSRFRRYKDYGVLGTWGIQDVKSMLREFKLSTSGNKDKLLDRLRQAYANECANEDANELSTCN